MKMKKIGSILFITIMCGCLYGFKSHNKVDDPQIYAGVGYLAAKGGASAEAGLVIGVVGVYESAVQGMLWGAAFGNVTGAVAGAVVGL